MRMPAAELIARGLDHHRRNQLDEAEECYTSALRLQPENAEALNLLGVIAQQRGLHAEGVELIKRAVAVQPAPHYLSNLTNALNQLGRSSEAVAAGLRAVALDPRAAAAHCNLGVAQRSLREFDEAAKSFRAAIELQPAYGDAHANLGVVLTELGRLDEAEQALHRALACGCSTAQTWYNLGGLLLRLHRWAEAVDAYRRAVSLRPDYADAFVNLGAALKASGDLDAARTAYAAAVGLSPGSALARHNLGLALAEQGRHQAAADELEQAIALDPHRPAWAMDLGNVLYGAARARQDTSALALLDRSIQAHRAALVAEPELVPAQYNLGLALLDRGRFEEAAGAFEQALILRPDYAEALCNLGHSLAELGRFDEAISACHLALALNAELAEALSTLGNALTGQNRLTAAEAAYRRAIALRPGLGGAHCNLGVALFRQGDADGALRAYDEALRLSPQLADAHWNRGLLLLQRGDYAQGWAEYEWRLKRAARVRLDAPYAQPLWTGEALQGASILLHAEQGLGDAIQCSRFIPAVSQRGGEVVLRTPASLMQLLGAISGVSRIVPDDGPIPQTKWRLPLFSLPRLFAPSPESLAPANPYLRADPQRAQLWADRLAAMAPQARMRIGVVWSGNVTAEVELGRSIPLRAFAPLTAMGDVQLFSLQKGHGLEQLTTAAGALGERPPLPLGPEYDAGSFAETAAVIAGLDLVIACDTSVAHLAGALGKPVWLAVNAIADWRWLIGRRDSPWYPSMRIFRQPRPGDWDAVMEEMGSELERLMRDD